MTETKTKTLTRKRISAEIIADSINSYGDRITSYLLTYPRYIHSELLTHRLFSRNAASSRAVPSKKMLELIKEDPFIPIAWQKAHKGMQGTEYFTDEESLFKLRTYWLAAMNQAVEKAEWYLEEKVTKQIINRLVEPYMWYTVIVTATEYDNFFNLRCPRYRSNNLAYTKGNIKMTSNAGRSFKSKKDWLKDYEENKDSYEGGTVPQTDIDWLKINKGAGEIHIMELAECMWDARNESKPKRLYPGQWHIPFGDNLEFDRIMETFPYIPVPTDENVTFSDNAILKHVENMKRKIAVARCARVSYLNFEGKDDYMADVKLYERLKQMKHMSPFEHVAKAMDRHEYNNHFKGEIEGGYANYLWEDVEDHHISPEELGSHSKLGWCRNLKGFIQERALIE